MQENAYPDQKVFIKTHKGYVTSKNFFWQIGKYRRIIQNILRIIQECAYPDQNVLIKTHKGYVKSKQKMCKIKKRKQKTDDFAKTATKIGMPV